MFYVVDRAPAHELTALAYWRLGRLYLELDSPEQAVSPLRRSVAAAAGSSAQPSIALTLAAAYMLTTNPQAAAAVIRENQRSLQQEPYRSMASFLETYARFRASTDRREKNRLASSLLAALVQIHDASVLPSVGELLVGKAYLDLGFGERMATVYVDAVERSRGLPKAELTYHLADYWYGAGKRTPAIERFTSLANATSGPWSTRARLRLAEIALEENKPHRCLEWCKLVLPDRGAIDVSALLKIMGRAFDLTGDFHQAAACYSGQIPEL